jgi:two-component system sensor histidine kinase AlgZ
LIIALIYLLYPVMSKLSLSRGLVLAWCACVLVPGIMFLMLPLIEPLLSEFVPGAIDRQTTRVSLWVLGLFVLPIVLVIEQLVFAQSEVEILEKEHEVSDLDFRIRPHFFFNSLNSVASLIVVDPLRAEEGLLDLADMFRIIMTDKRKLVPFSAEYEMAYKYMTLEKMRLGERLEDEWQIADIDETILLPILTLQPLIENAIYHGIETRLTGGKVSIKARQSRHNLYITIINPMPEAGKPVRKGNLIARENLENRFRQLYKGDASITYVETDDFYAVTIKVPAHLTLH